MAESKPTAIYIEAAADLSRAQDDLAKLLPGDIALVNRRIQHAVCLTSNGKQVCQDVRLTGRIVREGQARITGTPRGLELAVPLHYDLVAQPYGAGANTVINGKLTVTASFTMTLDEHWQPALKLDPAFVWSEGSKIKVLAGETQVQADVEPVLAQHLQKLPQLTEAELVPADLRQQVELTWRYLHYPIALSQEQQIWLRGTPLGLRYAGVTMRDGVTQVRMAITARIQTFVGERPAPLPPSPLAAPGSGPEPVSGGILLPQEVSYEAIAAAAALNLPAIPVRTVEGETSTFPQDVKSLAFFGSGKRVAVAVHFRSLPGGGGWFSGHGVAYFLATPGIKPGTSQLTLNQTELFVSGVKQPPLQKEMPFLADTRFAENVGAAMTMEVGDKLAGAVDLMKRQGSLPLAQGLRLYLTPGETKVARVSPGIDGLRLEVEVGGELNVHREGTDVAADTGAPLNATP